MFNACISVTNPLNASFILTMTGALPTGNPVGDFFITNIPLNLQLNTKKKMLKSIIVDDFSDSESSYEEVVVRKKKTIVQ